MFLTALTCLAVRRNVTWTRFMPIHLKWKCGVFAMELSYFLWRWTRSSQPVCSCTTTSMITVNINAAPVQEQREVFQLSFKPTVGWNERHPFLASCRATRSWSPWRSPAWFQSKAQNQTSSAINHNMTSFSCESDLFILMKCPATRHSYGVPQGSALGPALFDTYVHASFGFISNHDLHCHNCVMSFPVLLTICSCPSLSLKALETRVTGDDIPAQVGRTWEGHLRRIPLQAHIEVSIRFSMSNVNRNLKVSKFTF